MTRKFLLVAELDQAGRLRACRDLCRTFHRSNLVTTGEVKPGKADAQYFAHVHTRRRAKRDDRNDQLDIF